MTTRPNLRMTQGAERPREARATDARDASAFEPDIETSGEIPERPKGSDCKSDGTAFDGSNPSLPTSSRASRPAHPRSTAFRTRPVPATAPDSSHSTARPDRSLHRAQATQPQSVSSIANEASRARDTRLRGSRGAQSTPVQRNRTLVPALESRAKLYASKHGGRRSSPAHARPGVLQRRARAAGVVEGPGTLGGRSSMPAHAWRAEFNGRTAAFQAAHEGSIPFARSTRLVALGGAGRTHRGAAQRTAHDAPLALL